LNIGTLLNGLSPISRTGAGRYPTLVHMACGNRGTQLNRVAVAMAWWCCLRHAEAQTPFINGGGRRVGARAMCGLMLQCNKVNGVGCGMDDDFTGGRMPPPPVPRRCRRHY